MDAVTSADGTSATHGTATILVDMLRR
jgi:hypothetical protein